MPIVPLGITSKCIFRILNDGYENLNLTHIIRDDLMKMDKIDLQLIYLDGKVLGVTKSRLKMEVTFCHNKPISFTTKIEF